MKLKYNTQLPEASQLTIQKYEC